MNPLPDLPSGIWQHWKGPLYQVFGYGHDANADNLCYYSETMQRVYRHNRGNSDGPTKPVPLGERTCVVYMGLQLDGAHMGPRLAFRDVDDWFAWVDFETGDPLPQIVIDASMGSTKYIREHGYVQRFTYLGAQLTRGMMNDERD